MFSPRVLAIFAFGLAVVAALPADKTDRPWPRPVTTITDDDLDEGSWFTFPLFGNLFAPLWRLFPSFSEIGPRVIADENKFQIVVNAKEYKKEDIKVKVKGFFIMVQGTHETKQDDKDLFASQFFHTYTLPVNASGSDVTAELSSDGYLVVEAPLKGQSKDKAEDIDRDVPIKETGVPYKKVEQIPEKPVEGDFTTVSEDDRKEPTTPSSQREEFTEKDNSIPHGGDETI